MSSTLAPSPAVPAAAASATPGAAGSAPLSAQTLPEALALAESAGSVREAAALLRQRFAPLRVVVVDAMDMRGEPVAVEGPTRRLYLGATDGHCWHMTSDPAVAAGLFLCDR